MLGCAKGVVHQSFVAATACGYVVLGGFPDKESTDFLDRSAGRVFLTPSDTPQLSRKPHDFGKARFVQSACDRKG